MPEFKGNAKDFNTYLGGFCKNFVNRFTKAFRKKYNINKCEYCNSQTILESAHRDGKGRLTIINEVLTKNFQIGHNLFDVDLNNFKKLFEEAHQPLRAHFWFLCSSCHRKYDNKEFEEKDILENLTTNNDESLLSLIHLLNNINPSIKEYSTEKKKEVSLDKNIESYEYTYNNSMKNNISYSKNEDFEEWLKQRYKAYKQYLYWFFKVMERENLTWSEIEEKIGSLIVSYEIGGREADFGQQGHRTVINALKRFQDFIRQRS